MKEQDNGLSAEQLAKLRRMFHRPILTSNDVEYTATRQIWNGQFDRRPSVIVQPISIAEVMQSVRFARDEGLAATVRGGGHSGDLFVRRDWDFGDVAFYGLKVSWRCR
jgi:hypothetical protein